jgi:hypothetical protein
MGKPPYTRQLLRIAASYGGDFDRNHAERLLQQMEGLGLLRRYEDYERIGRRMIQVVRNDPTPLAVRLLSALGVIDLEEEREEVLELAAEA